MSNFAAAMAHCAKTWNGAVSLLTPDISGKTSGRMSLFFKSVRGLTAPRLYTYLREASAESVHDAFALGFHIRDCRGGKGERALGRKSLVWLFLNYPDEFAKVSHLIAEYGRWDDLLELFPGVLKLNSKNLKFLRNNYSSNIEDESSVEYLSLIQQSFVDIVGNQLKKDKADMEQGNPISVCAKWAPTEGDSLDSQYGLVRTLCDSMGITLRAYRKQYLTPLRAYLQVVESLMCSKRWNEIDFSRVPSHAMKRLKKKFAEHAPKEFEEWKRGLETVRQK